MYLLIVYNDLKQERICGLFKFKFVKDVVKWSNRVITHSDINTPNSRYKSYKKLFKIVRLKKIPK